MSNIQHVTSAVNVPVTLTIQGVGVGLPVAADLVLMYNGAVNTTTAVTFADPTSPGSSWLYNYTFTPTLGGTYLLYAYGAIQARIDVVAQTIYTSLQNLQDEALGSWVWDKVANTLVMLKQDGTNLANFAVVDNLTQASRERTS